LSRTAEIRDLALLLLLGAAWGSAFLFIKVAVADIPPFTLSAARLAIAAGLVLIVLRLRGRRLPRDAAIWRRYLIIGLLGNTLPNTLIAAGETQIDSGLAAILMAIAPLVTLLMAHFLVAGERLNAVKLCGIALGFAGVLVLVGPQALAGLSVTALAQFAVLGAALCYAVNTIVASGVRDQPALVSGAATIVGACVTSIPFSLAIDAPWTLSVGLWPALATLALAVISTAGGVVLYFVVLRSAGPSFVGQVNYVVPVMGVFWGWLILSERVGLWSLLALALILLGVALTRRGARYSARPSTSTIE